MKKLLLLLFSLMLSFNIFSEEDLSEYKLLGQKTVVAFKCANIVTHHDYSEEVGIEWNRLFNIGMSSGTKLLEAMRSGIITRDFMNKHIPLMLTLRISDSGGLFSNDFILGGLNEEMLVEVFEKVGDASIRDTTSRSMYLKNNCALVGN
jgi:hypothetical protein